MTQKSFDCGSSNWLAGYKESRRDGKCGCWTRNCSTIVLHITYLSNGNHRISSAFGIALNDYLTVSSWEFPGNNLRHRRWEMTNGIPMHSLVKVWDQTVDFKCQQCNDTPNYSRLYIYIHILCIPMQDMGLFEKGLYRTPNDQYNRQHDDQLWDLGIPYFPDK